MRKKGFTLIELLVVIAIIAILATVILVNLNAGRDRAKATNVLSSLRSVQGTAISCSDAGSVLTAPSSVTAGGGKVCATAPATDTWPPIGAAPAAYGFQYGISTDPLPYDFVATSGAFNYGAYKTGDTTWNVGCSMTGCTKAGF